MAPLARTINRFFASSLDRFAPDAFIRAKSGKVPDTFSIFCKKMNRVNGQQALYAAVYSFAILAGASCTRSADADNATSAQQNDATQLLWTTSLPDELKYRTRQASVVSADGPVILATRPGGLFRIEKDPISHQAKITQPFALPMEGGLGDEVILPSPAIVTRLSDTPLGILAYRHHAVTKFRLVNIMGKTLAELEDPRHFHYRLAPDGNSFIGVDSGGKHVGLTTQRLTYRFFNRMGKIVGEVQASPFSWDEFSYSPDGKGILINDREDGLSHYDAATAKRIWTIPAGSKYFASANSSVHRVVAVRRENRKQADLYEAGKLVWTIDLTKLGINENIRNVAISPQGNLVVVTGNRTLLILEAGSSVPIARYQMNDQLTINSVAVSDKGRVALGAQQAHLAGTESAFGRVLLLDKHGSLLFQENTQHERSNAWIPTVRFDPSGKFLLVRTRESFTLRAVS